MDSFRSDIRLLGLNEEVEETVIDFSFLLSEFLLKAPEISHTLLTPSSVVLYVVVGKNKFEIMFFNCEVLAVFKITEDNELICPLTLQYGTLYEVQELLMKS